MSQSDASIDPFERRRNEAWRMSHDPTVPYSEAISNALHHLEAESVGGHEGLYQQQVQYRARQATREAGLPLLCKPARQANPKGPPSDCSNWTFEEHSRGCKCGSCGPLEPRETAGERDSDTSKSREPWQSQVEEQTDDDDDDDIDRDTEAKDSEPRESGHSQRKNPNEDSTHVAGTEIGIDHGSRQSGGEPRVGGSRADISKDHVTTPSNASSKLKRRRKRVRRSEKYPPTNASSVSPPSATSARPPHPDHAQSTKLSQAHPNTSIEDSKPDARLAQNVNNASHETIRPSKLVLDRDPSIPLPSGTQGHVNGDGVRSREVPSSFHRTPLQDTRQCSSPVPQFSDSRIRRWIDDVNVQLAFEPALPEARTNCSQPAQEFSSPTSHAERPDLAREELSTAGPSPQAQFQKKPHSRSAPRPDRTATSQTPKRVRQERDDHAKTPVILPSPSLQHARRRRLGRHGERPAVQCRSEPSAARASHAAGSNRTLMDGPSPTSQQRSPSRHEAWEDQVRPTTRISRSSSLEVVAQRPRLRDQVKSVSPGLTSSNRKAHGNHNVNVVNQSGVTSPVFMYRPHTEVNPPRQSAFDRFRAEVSLRDCPLTRLFRRRRRSKDHSSHSSSCSSNHW